MVRLQIKLLASICLGDLRPVLLVARSAALEAVYEYGRAFGILSAHDAVSVCPTEQSLPCATAESIVRLIALDCLLRRFVTRDVLMLHKEVNCPVVDLVAENSAGRR